MYQCFRYKHYSLCHSLLAVHASNYKRNNLDSLKKDINCLCFPGTEKDTLTKPRLGIGLIILLDNSNDKTRGSNVLYLHTMIRGKH